MLLGALLAWWEVGESSSPWSYGVFVVCAFLVVAGLIPYAELRQSSRSVLVDRTLGVIEVRQRNWLLQERAFVYSLSRFNRVRSLLTPGRWPKVQVQLLEKEVGCALVVVSYSPASGARDFFSLPSYAEPEMAGQLRQQLAKYLGFPDLGYMGNLWYLPTSTPDRGG
jgi:hypothetical protein